MEISDESRLRGICEQIETPDSAESLRKLIQTAVAAHRHFTIAGAKTGITGGAIPQKGLVIQTTALKTLRPAENGTITVGAGVTLGELNAALAKNREYCFAPDPTEESATLGGLFACGGGGANRSKYGTIPENTVNLEWITPDGSLWKIPRGDFVFDKTGCTLPDATRLNCKTYPSQRPVHLLTPSAGTDLIDFLGGSEGTIGVAVSLTLRLQKRLLSRYGIVWFFEKDDYCAEFLRQLRDVFGAGKKMLESCEYLCAATISLLEKNRANTQSLRRFPAFPTNADCALLTILADTDDHSLEEVLTSLYERFCACGGTESGTWSFEGENETATLRALRHAVPELVNVRLDSQRAQHNGFYELTKIGTDFTVPIPHMRYRTDIIRSGIEGYVFGHVLDNHLHVNLLPSNPAQLEAAVYLVDSWARETIRLGGQLISENGVGRLKSTLLEKHLPSDYLKNMLMIRTFFDRQKLMTRHILSGDYPCV